MQTQAKKVAAYELKDLPEDRVQRLCFLLSFALSMPISSTV